MTKKSILALVLAVFLVLMLAACGNDKNKEESENTDTGDTDTATVTDTEPTDTGDTEAVPDEEPAEVDDTEIVPDTDPADTGDSEIVPDEEPAETDDSEPGTVTQEGCTIKSSFGTHSLKKDIAETCIKEIAKARFAECTWNYKNEEETSQHIAYLQKLEITFGKECKNEDQTVECPDFIPETLKLESLSGCDVYSIDPDTDCLAPCTDLYFPTGDDIFHTVYVGGDYDSAFIKSSAAIEDASFSSTLNNGSNNAVFKWSEKGEGDTEIEKTVSVEMFVK